MPSPAWQKFEAGARRAAVLLKAVGDRRLRPISRLQAQSFAHASLASLVSAWDAYLHELVRNFYEVVSDPLRPHYSTLHTIAKEAADRSGERFHTPNWENARAFIASGTGYGPISDWIWPARRMGGPEVRERLKI